MKRNLIPFDDKALLHIAKRFASGDDYLERDRREAVRSLLSVLRRGSPEARRKAWKIVDSGVVGNQVCFLLMRFRDQIEKGRSMRRYGIPYVWPFSAAVICHYAEVLWWTRIVLYAAETVMLAVLIIRLFI